jgi:hypothetical protein
MGRVKSIKVELFCTSDYDVFKPSKENRSIRQSNLNKIAKSFKKRPAQRYCPIVVDKNYQVIDGQHRLEACRILNLPVYFWVADSKDIDLAQMNYNQCPWDSLNFVEYYAKKGLPSYKLLLADVKATKIPVTAIGQVILDRRFTFKEELAEGELEYTKEDSKKVRSYVAQAEYFTGYKFAKTYRFIRAIVAFHKRLPYVDLKKLAEKAERYPSLLKNQTSWKEFCWSLVELYNYHNKAERLNLPLDFFSGTDLQCNG